MMKPDKFERVRQSYMKELYTLDDNERDMKKNNKQHTYDKDINIAERLKADLRVKIAFLKCYKSVDENRGKNISDSSTFKNAMDFLTEYAEMIGVNDINDLKQQFEVEVLEDINSAKRAIEEEKKSEEIDL